MRTVALLGAAVLIVGTVALATLVLQVAKRIDERLI